MLTAVGIHVFADSDNRRQEWRAFARHDPLPQAAGQS
jgi:hypothetical protein